MVGWNGRSGNAVAEVHVFMQEFDTQLNRALLLENYADATDVRQRRQTIDEAIEKIKVNI
jgi:hypothetical protein